MRNLLASDLFTDSELQMFCGAESKQRPGEDIHWQSELEPNLVTTDEMGENLVPRRSLGVACGKSVREGGPIDLRCNLPSAAKPTAPNPFEEDESDGPDPYDAAVETEMEREARDERSS